MRVAWLLAALALTACVRPASQPGPITEAQPTPLCAAVDFESSANAEAVRGQVMLGMTLIQRGENPCALPNLPALRLLDGNGSALNVQYDLLDPPEAPKAPLVEPGDRVIVVAQWKNFCESLPGSGITLRVELPGGGALDAALTALQPPTCFEKQNPSRVAIHPFTFPP